MLTPYKLKGRLQHRDAVRLPLMTDFIVVRQQQAHTSCKHFGFYRRPPTTGTFVPQLFRILGVDHTMLLNVD